MTKDAIKKPKQRQSKNASPRLSPSERKILRFYRGYGSLEVAADRAGVSYSYASKIIRREHVRAALGKNGAQVEDMELNVAGRKSLVAEVAIDPLVPNKERLAAVEVLNKMEGTYVKKVEMSASIDSTERKVPFDKLEPCIRSLLKGNPTLEDRIRRLKKRTACSELDSQVRLKEAEIARLIDEWPEEAKPNE